MFRGFGRKVQRTVRRRSACRGGRGTPEWTLFPGCELILTLLLGISVAAGAVVLLGMQMRPLAAVAAKAQAENMVNRLVEETILKDLEQRPLGYDDLVTIQRDGSGTITALTADMAAMNLLRGQLLEHLLEELGGIHVSDIHIPLGSVLDVDILWAKGPNLKVHSMSVGTVSAEFESEFTGAGVNQTLHRIWLEVKVPLTMILPGDRVETQVTNRLCVAETVVVGKVPDTYLQPIR